MRMVVDVVVGEIYVGKWNTNINTETNKIGDDGDPSEGEVVDVVGGEVYVGTSKMELAPKFTPKSVGGLVGVLGSLTAPYILNTN